MSVRAFLRGAPAAVTFLTIIPVPGYRSRRGDWHWTPAWFPVIGAVIGCILASVWHLSDWLGRGVTASMVVLVSILLTGALHEDGLADSVDALGGSHNRDRLFEILKDSRIGTYGALALIASVLLRVMLVIELDARAGAALVLSHTLARTAPVWLMATLPYVTPPTTARSTAVAGAGQVQMLFATALSLFVVAGLAGARSITAAGAVTALLGVAAATGLLAHWFRKRAAGVTGDFLGMTEQICECVTLLGLVVAYSR